MSYTPFTGSIIKNDGENSRNGLPHPPVIQEVPEPIRFPSDIPETNYFSDTFGKPKTGLSGESVLLFSNKSIRLAFIRKVFGILTLQLFVTTGAVALFTFQPDIKNHMQTSDNLVWIVSVPLLVIALVILGVLRFFKKVSRMSPLNLILLGLFTICLAIPVGCYAAFFETKIIVFVGGFTLFVCLTVSLFTFQSKWDFTICGGIMFVLIAVSTVTLILWACLPSELNVLLISFGGSLLFSVYIISLVQVMMMSDKGCCSVSPEDYVMAANYVFFYIILAFLSVVAIAAALASSDSGGDGCGNCNCNGCGNCSGGGGGQVGSPCYWNSCYCCHWGNHSDNPRSRTEDEEEQSRHRGIGDGEAQHM